MSDKENYELAVQTAVELRNKLNESVIEREELGKRLTLLNQELRLQESHFNSEMASKDLELKSLQENSMAKDSGLIMKLKQMSEHNHTTE